MNDYQLIKNNLEFSRGVDELAQPWVFRWYIIAFCFAPAFLILFLGRIADDANFLVLSGQYALAYGTYLALFQLRDKPLLNPIQAVVLLFHWWFAVGPSLAVFFAVKRSDPDMLSRYVASGGEALWVVALGIQVYAFSANRTMHWCRGRINHASFLMPDGLLYRQKTLLAYWLVGGVLALVIAVLARFGIVGNQTISYLGGTVSENWFVSALEAIGAIAIFATVGVMGYLAGPVLPHTLKFKMIAVGLIIFNTITAFTSGWKGAIVQGFALIFIVMFVWRQKVPYILVAVLALSYLFIIEPFVNNMRYVAEIAKISTTEERAELFKIGLDSGIVMDEMRDHEVNIESPFRGIFLLANGIAEESSLFNGPWDNTISEGMLSLVPRAIYPDKPDMNMGNFFGRYLGAVDPDDYMTNMGVSIPFEFVGNYGYMAGILSFGLIGIVWTLFCVWLLSADRLATHPLAPLCIIFALGLEASVGQFLAKFRDLPLVFGAAFIVWIALKKRL
ncbi:hypothetical protein [Geobacter sp. AOG1]|uniref:hypothetical protein n=1 Tax=Geobacter sp. AOG1 TaxID=1566346 RepID=UPI001CC423C8|nr:hypothetical protein [Geobacter sp. AOG1]